MITVNYFENNSDSSAVLFTFRWVRRFFLFCIKLAAAKKLEICTIYALKCRKTHIRSGSKNKKHFRTVLSRQYGQNPSVKYSWTWAILTASDCRLNLPCLKYNTLNIEKGSDKKEIDGVWTIVWDTAFC